MAYVYRGTTRDIEEETTTKPRPRQRAPFDPTKCGTYAGYKQHDNTGTPHCRPCKDAANKYVRELRARHKISPIIRGFQPDKCGTLAGYSRHKRHDVPVCDPCKQARAEHRRDYYERAAA